LLALGLAAGAFAVANGGGLFERSYLRTAIHPEIEGYDQVLATTAASIPRLAGLLAFPTTLSADHRTPLEAGLGTPRSLAGAALLTSWVVLGAMLSRRNPTAAYAVAWTLITWLPCSNLVPLTHFFVAERYLYLPSFGICLLASIAADHALARAARKDRTLQRAGLMLCCAGLLATFTARTVAHGFAWRDSYSLWSSALRQGARTARVHNNLGTALFERGEWEAAIRELESALRLEPDHSLARLNLANALLASGRYSLAETILRQALTHAPDDARAHYRLAVALSALGRKAEAVEAAERAVGLQPDDPAALHWLGVLLIGEGRLEESLPLLERSIVLRPASHEARLSLGNLLLRLGRPAAAAPHFAEAAKLAPERDRVAPRPPPGTAARLE
jgi:tetratricopeptide (TPR) repeat protein